MNNTAEINAVIRNAKQQRAEYIGAKVQASALPVALVALVSLALVQLTAAPSHDQAPQAVAAEVSGHNG